MSAAALPVAFYDRPVLEVAVDLLGCELVCGGASGVIVETEAYHETEAACHAHIGLTDRTRVLLGPPGRAYVYLSYGIHALVNMVCERDGVGAAVLVRGLEPCRGIARMAERRGPTIAERSLCSGPGKLTQALGITLAMNGTSLRSGPIRVLPRRGEWCAPDGSPDFAVIADPRIGITKAAELPWRFCVAGSPYVSRRPRPDAARVWPVDSARV